MSNSSEAATLASLRARTDRELIAIIRSALERGLDLLHRHADRGAVEQHRTEAEQSHGEAVKLLPLVYDLTESDRHRLEVGLAELRSALDAVCGAEAPQVRAAGR
jgi:hypothetical protein